MEVCIKCKQREEFSRFNKLSKMKLSFKWLKISPKATSLLVTFDRGKIHRLQLLNNDSRIAFAINIHVSSIGYEFLITGKVQFLSLIFIGMVSGSVLMLDFPVEMQEKLLTLFNAMESDFQQ